MSGRPIGSMESTSISPSSIRYRPPTFTCGRVQMRTLQVISPRRTPSRKRLVNVIASLSACPSTLHSCAQPPFRQRPFAGSITWATQRLRNFLGLVRTAERNAAQHFDQILSCRGVVNLVLLRHALNHSSGCIGLNEARRDGKNTNALGLTLAKTAVLNTLRSIDAQPRY